MSESLLQTKLLPPPIRPYLIPRPLLHEKLDGGLNGRVTLVSAPAGYGKTTLVAGWLPHCQCHTLWYSLDEYDNDPGRFLRYFTAVWQQLDPTMLQNEELVFQANPIGISSQPVETFFTLLINKLIVRQGKWLLVLDDVHLLENVSLHKALTFWVEHSPPQVHTVLISRIEPPLPLARWRVRGQLQDISSRDLQLSNAETADFLRQAMQLELSTDDIALLAERTDGWIAGLQLAALSLQQATDPHQAVQAFTGSNRQIMAYLLDEVWQQQPGAIQHFLLQTAVPHRFNVPLANLLTGQNNSRQFIAELDRKHLFLRPLDNQQNWYSYHPIFAEFLQTQLQDNPVAYHQLHQQASGWFADHGLMEEAIHHALAAQLFDTAANYILQQAHETLWNKSRSRTLLRWCDTLPPETMWQMPELVTHYAWALVWHGKISQLAVFLDRAEAYWQATAQKIPAATWGEVATLRGEVALIHGRIPDALAWFEKANALIPAENRWLSSASHQVQGYAYRLNGDLAKARHSLQEARRLASTQQEQSVQLSAAYDYAQTFLMAGDLQAAEQIYRQALTAVPPEIHPSLATLTLHHTGLAELLLLRHRLAQAHEHVEQGIQLSQLTSEENPMMRQGILILAHIKQAQGDWANASKLLARLQQITLPEGNARIIDSLAMKSANLHLLQGDVEPVRPWLEQRLVVTHEPATIPAYQYHEEQIVLGRYGLRTDPAPTIARLQNLQATAVAQGWLHHVLHTNILLALAYQALGKQEMALTALVPALLLADEQGYIWPFVAEGKAMAGLLQLALKQGTHPRATGKIQAAFETTAVANQPLTEPLHEPLTDRELEVLSLLAAGRTNPEIAAQLVLATGTVAKYTNNIFSKLAVRNRTEAARRAKEVGLLP